MTWKPVIKSNWLANAFSRKLIWLLVRRMILITLLELNKKNYSNVAYQRMIFWRQSTLTKRLLCNYIISRCDSSVIYRVEHRSAIVTVTGMYDRTDIDLSSCWTTMMEKKEYIHDPRYDKDRDPKIKQRYMIWYKKMQFDKQRNTTLVSLCVYNHHQLPLYWCHKWSWNWITITADDKGINLQPTDLAPASEATSVNSCR